MFERLGEIVASGERYSCHQGSDEPLIFTWMPSTVDSSSAVGQESTEQKVDRVTKMIKSARSELGQLSSCDLELEERLLTFLELRQGLGEHALVLGLCETADPEVQAMVSRGRGMLQEVVVCFEGWRLEETTGQMVVEQKFQTGLTSNLIPWIDRLEKESFRVLEKPENFGHAQEIEKEAVVFAKEVRRANKLLGELTNSVETLPSKKMFSAHQIDEQKLRFKKIAQVAASRVETTRDLLVNWTFYMDTKGEAERLSNTVRAMFALEQLPALFALDENDFLHGLPRVALGWLHQAEQVVTSPPRPTDLAHSSDLAKLFTQFCAVVELASKLLERIEECTEKTPSQEEVWEQRQRMKKVQAKAKTMAVRQDKLGGHWQTLATSGAGDNLDFQPLVVFLTFYGECYA